MKVNQEKLIKLLHEKWKGITCPYCQAAQWNVDTSITTTVGVSEDRGIQIGGRFLPLISVTCGKCGNTVLVNGLVLGCLDDVDNGVKDNER